MHSAINQVINSDINQIEKHLSELDLKKREQIKDSYSRVVAKFQKWMIHLYFERSFIKLDPESKPNEDEQVIIDFAYIYSQIFPSMYFYQIKNPPCIQGFDLISLLMTDFKYLGIAFYDLPIVYQTVFEQIEICLVWFDDKLKLKLEEFYINSMKLLQVDYNLLKLNILPVSLLESEDFSNVVKNSHKIRVRAEYDGKNIENHEKNLEKPYPLKELFKTKDGKIYLWSYSLELINEYQEDLMKSDKQDQHNENGKLNLSYFYIIQIIWLNNY